MACEQAPPMGRETAAALASRGWAVVDEFFSPSFAEGLRDDVVTLAALGSMLPNKTYFANPSGGRHLFSKPFIFEVDLLQADVNKDTLPCLQKWFELSSTTWAENLQMALPSWEILSGPEARTVKLQWNRGTQEGGGSFPCHYDNPGPPSRRALTCIVYLNPEWKAGDGGEIVLRPFLEQPVLVAPRMNRAVLFASDWVLHSVQPSLAERFCITTWMDGDGTNLPEHRELRLPPTAMQDLEGTAELLRTSPSQRLLSRAIDRELYEATLVTCMSGAKGLEEMLSAHREHVEGSRRNGPVWRLVEALRELRRERRGDRQQRPAAAARDDQEPGTAEACPVHDSAAGGLGRGGAAALGSGGRAAGEVDASALDDMAEEQQRRQGGGDADSSAARPLEEWWWWGDDPPSDFDAAAGLQQPV